ncbi:DUF998 domain-containing protein [Micromonospora sp. IBHARD004]|uniref:DUF998 domain-containing protein n=1 Tax=Micromonospora sp. IBHARD004 TaxID=3457764 RepID=UPI00405982A1
MTTVRPAVGRPIEAGAVVDAGGAATVGADPDLPARATRAAGLCATALSMLLFGVLHVTVHRVHPVRDTLSDYALTRDGWLFGAAVLALAAGSALLLSPFAGAAARRTGRLRALAARVAFGAWCLGLTVLVAFPRDPVGAPATIAGDIHRLAAVAALCGLPVGALLTAVRHPGRCAGAVLVASAGCLLALLPFVAAYLVASPLRPAVGLIERAVSLGEVVVLLLTARLCRTGGEPFPGASPAADGGP